MGTEERPAEPHLSAADRAQDVETVLRAKVGAFEESARRFSFYRLVYLLERLAKGAPQVGQLGPPSAERIRLRSETSLVFAASDVSALEMIKYPDGTYRARLTSAFMGLYGSSSPLPTHFSESLAFADYQGGPQPIRDFLDVFHHRLLSLVYRAWAKYRFSVAYAKGGVDPFARRMFCAVGVDGFKDYSTALSRFLFLRYAPILGSKSRSARGLEAVLRDTFGQMGLRLEQFVGHWTLIEKPLRNQLGIMNCRLGEDLTLGRYVYDGTGRFTIVLGPLEYDQYLSFLPGGHNRPLMRGIVDTFTRGAQDAMLELHVKPDAAPRYQLGSPRAATIKRTAWLGGSKGQPFVITVPLEEPKPRLDGDDEEDRGEPPS